MRNRLRVLAVDVLAPLAAVAALVYVGLALAWPLWWVSLCSVLCLLVVQGVIVNAVLFRKDGVTVGTDDEGPGLRLGVVAIAAAALVGAVAVGYLQWTVPERDLRTASVEVVNIASSAAEAYATFTPASPTVSRDRLVSMMTADGAQRTGAEFDAVSQEYTGRNISVSASTVSAGVEAVGPDDALVAVVMRGTQSVPGKPQTVVALPLRVALTREGDRWLVADLSPINSR